MKWLLWPLAKGRGSWHLYSFTTQGDWVVMLCGRYLSPDRPPADESDLPLPAGSTCNSCLNVKASKEKPA